MAYERLKLKPGETLTAAHMAHIEDGIEANDLKDNATDRTLSREGVAADAKAAGTAIKELREEVNNKPTQEYVDGEIDFAKQYTDQKIDALVETAPEALNTLKELSEALGNDPNFAATVLAKLTALEAEIKAKSKESVTVVSTEENMDTLLNNATAADVGKSYLYIGEKGKYLTGSTYMVTVAG
jgi:hypothetical protein